MEKTIPDSPGTGSIVLQADERGGIHVKWSDMEVITITDLFYHALLNIPNSYNAMAIAMERYNNEMLKS